MSRWSKCERCGVELDDTDVRESCVCEAAGCRFPHTAERCAERLVEQRDCEPHHRIPGCQHSRARMHEWESEGACPICLTATCGMMREAAKEQQVVLEENAQAADRLANEVRELSGLNNKHVAKLEAAEARVAELQKSLLEECERVTELEGKLERARLALEPVAKYTGPVSIKMVGDVLEAVVLALAALDTTKEKR